MTGGLITLRFALAIRPRPGFRLGLVAATATVVGAVLVLLRNPLSGLVDPDVFVGLLGLGATVSATHQPGLDSASPPPPRCDGRGHDRGFRDRRGAG
jgi:hypothetical protein